MNLGSPKRRVLKAVQALGADATPKAVRQLAGRKAWPAIGYLRREGYLAFVSGRFRLLPRKPSP